MSYVIPDPRFEMPELFEPGVKPSGNFVIDWNNFNIPFHSFYLWNNFSPYDLAGTVPKSNVLVEGSAMTIKNGSLLWDRTDSNHVRINDNNTDGSVDPYPWAFASPDESEAEWTVVHHYKLDPNAPSSSDEYTLSSKVPYTYGDNAQITIPHTPTKDGDSHTIAVSHSSILNTVVTYIDGVLVDETSTVRTSFGHAIRYQTNTSSWEIQIMDNRADRDLCIGGVFYKAGDRWQGNIHASLFIKQYSDHGLLKKLSNNPYQFLIPA